MTSQLLGVKVYLSAAICSMPTSCHLYFLSPSCFLPLLFVPLLLPYLLAFLLRPYFDIFPCNNATLTLLQRIHYTCKVLANPIHVCVCVCVPRPPRPPLACFFTRVGQSHTYTPYVTVCLVISLAKIPLYTLYMYGFGQPCSSLG
jgi:hypothetical protein